MKASYHVLPPLRRSLVEEILQIRGVQDEICIVFTCKTPICQHKNSRCRKFCGRYSVENIMLTNSEAFTKREILPRRSENPG